MSTSAPSTSVAHSPSALASQEISFTPSLRSRADRVNTVTSSPAARNLRASAVPRKPLPPAIMIFFILLPSFEPSLCMPFVRNVAHEKGAVEYGRTGWEKRGVFKEARFNLFDRQRFHPPFVAVKFQAVELVCVCARGPTQRAGLEEI